MAQQRIVKEILRTSHWRGSPPEAVKNSQFRTKKTAYLKNQQKAYLKNYEQPILSYNLQ